MPRQQKALVRLLSKPAGFTWSELRMAMASLGYELKATGGSGRKFVKPDAASVIHEPHPHKLLKAYQIRQVILFLKKEGDIK